MTMIGAKINIRGVVQGVGFRFWTLRKAQDYGLSGYVANLPDGSVEVKAEGERGLIESFLADLKVGPSYSHVSDLNLEWYEPPRGFENFSIRHGDY